jgi:ubiquitin C-terminal hydrolase
MLSTNYTGYHIIAGPYMAVIMFGKSFLLHIVLSEVMNTDSRKWYDCNDSWVKQISGPDSDSASAYVLFYVQQSQLL